MVTGIAIEPADANSEHVRDVAPIVPEDEATMCESEHSIAVRTLTGEQAGYGVERLAEQHAGGGEPLQAWLELPINDN